ncbi:MAG: exodeoxyribonuclease VII large subunit [Myxococcales bacterium]|nr:exodeoxyribonuclease VII large subunit [Myxococcales bacterium]
MNDNALSLSDSGSKPLTVAELTRAAKGFIEERFGPSVWVEGEVASAHPSPSGHLYFELKDDREDVRLACVMWKGNRARLTLEMKAGDRVQLRGRPTIFPGRGQFQFTADAAIAAGAGAQAAALAALKEKLRAEGLFDPAGRRPLPRFPRVIGVVTSATGAALGDIVRECDRRAPSKIVVSPTMVQGAGAAEKIVAALTLIQRVRALDVVIIGRGGGASEDLGAFNDEALARAIRACKVPVVSAVGHDVDHTIADLVADARATTPTQAAALVTPNFAEIRESLDARQAALRRAVRLALRQREVKLGRRKLPDPRLRVNELRQRFDHQASALAQQLKLRLRGAGARLDALEARLQGAHPAARVREDQAIISAHRARLEPAALRLLQRTRDRLGALEARLLRAVEKLVEARKVRVGLAAGKLHALSPLAILERGYAVALHNGRALTDAADVRAGDRVWVRLHRGAFEAEVQKVEPGP